MLQTKRLKIRLYRQNDKPAWMNLVTDPDVMKNVDEGVLSRSAADALWDKMFNKLYPEGVDTIFAVFSKSDDRYIGHCSIRPRPTLPEDWEIGYILLKDEWGNGFATEIALRLIEFGFDDLNKTEIFATIDDENTSSINVAEKAGMKFIRHEYDSSGRFSVYSIKKEDHTAKFSNHS